MELTEHERTVMVTWARTHIGVPFFHAGRNENGLDCIGLVIAAAAAANVFILDDQSYSPIVNAEYLWKRLRDTCDIVMDFELLLPGDIILFNIAASPQHVAMVTEPYPNIMIIHAFQTVGHVVEHELDRHWDRRIVGLYRPVNFRRGV